MQDFSFATTTPGVDYILANTKYLEDRKHKVKASSLLTDTSTTGIPTLWARLATTTLHGNLTRL